MMQLNQFTDTTALNQDFAQRLVTILQQAISERGAAYLVVSGGKTPQALFNTLSQTDLAWDKVTVLLADDRWLDDSQQDSNERLVKATLLQYKASAAQFISLYANTASAFDGAAQVLPRVAALPAFDAVISITPQGKFPITPSALPRASNCASVSEVAVGISA